MTSAERPPPSSLPTTLTEVAAAVEAAASYLTLATTPRPSEGWLSCAGLLGDPGAVRRSVAATASGRGTDDLRVLGSLWQQSYAFRVPSVVVAAHALGLPLPTTDPARTWVRLAGHRPGQVGVDDPDLHPDPGVGALAEQVVSGHLQPLAEVVHEAVGTPRTVLAGNTASCLVRVFAAVDRLPAAGSFLAAAARSLPDVGGWVGEPGAARWRRASCCLWFRTSEGGYCDDCVIPDRATTKPSRR